MKTLMPEGPEEMVYGCLWHCFTHRKKKDQTLQAAAGSFACFACPKILQDLGEPSGFTWKGRLLTLLKHLQEISME